MPAFKIQPLLLHVLVTLSLYAFQSSPLSEAAVCYVHPTEPHNATCPSKPCYTLDEYVNNSSRYFVSSTAFIFLTGHHDLSNNLTVPDVHNISLRPHKEKSYVVIHSKYATSMGFEVASDIAIKSITFQNVGFRFNNCTNITLTRLTAEDSAHALILRNIFGLVSIAQFTCTLNKQVAYRSPACLEIYSERDITPTPNTSVLLRELNITGFRSCQECQGVNIHGCNPGEIFLADSNFTYMRQGMSFYKNCSYHNSFLCENTRFYHNYLGLVLQPSHPFEEQLTTMIFFHNVLFDGNTKYATSITNSQNVTFSNCHFKESGEGAVYIINSILFFKGNVTFIDNHSDYAGGAISLIGECHIMIPDPDNTHILFGNNTAGDVGGAIYFSNPKDIHSIQHCRIFLEPNLNKTIFEFILNSAHHGGNAIYGAYLQSPCYSPSGALFLNLSDILIAVSSFFPPSADPSSISSDAQKIVFCKGRKVGEGDGSLPDQVYPGQVFEVSVAVHGDMNGLVKWPVYAVIDPGNLGDELQSTQYTSAEGCTTLKYSILSKSESCLFTYSSDIHFNDNNRIDFRIHLRHCPFGFALNASEGCDCNEVLQNIESITCDITEQVIHRQGTTWIGAMENSSNLVFSTVCPFRYCNISDVAIHISESLSEEDTQCNDNRAGVLCGCCRNNFSLALGSNKCLQKCSHKSLNLVIAFAVAGIALVFFIKILNLTVSQGTINGLIFYTNIVGVEQTTLSFSNAFQGFLSGFIAWVNLDLGIETCFFNGMDAYTKAWLQFVFPFYVWVIALFIIILSHYSIRASKLFGNNSVPVLATLILLSYSKLLRAVISALSITYIQSLNGSTISVWERDGNIQYLTGKHIPLFVFAVAVLVLLWFPFTLVLGSFQWLQKRTHYRVLRWLIKLVPFFDAFTGPLKDKHRYWVGALLLTRCILLLVFNLYTVNGSGVAFISIIFSTLFILVFLAAIGFVYKNYYLTVLELSYILNLGVLATGTLYVRYINNRAKQEALAITSVGIAFLQFMATVIYHTYVQLREPLKKLKARLGYEKDANGPDLNEYKTLDGAPCNEQPISPPFREPLLGYLDD